MCQLIEPYGDGLDLKKDIGTEQKHILKGSKLEKVEVDVGPTSGFRSISPDESKEIKNIYIDCKRLLFFVFPKLLFKFEVQY
jgi:katanin p80 WD40 repeat-containing subunit B1